MKLTGSFQCLGNQGPGRHVVRDAHASVSIKKEMFERRLEPVSPTTSVVKALPTELSYKGKIAGLSAGQGKPYITLVCGIISQALMSI